MDGERKKSQVGWLSMHSRAACCDDDKDEDKVVRRNRQGSDTVSPLARPEPHITVGVTAGLGRAEEAGGQAA